MRLGHSASRWVGSNVVAGSSTSLPLQDVLYRVLPHAASFLRRHDVGRVTCPMSPAVLDADVQLSWSSGLVYADASASRAFWEDEFRVPAREDAPADFR